MAVVSRIVNWVRVVVGALGQLGPQTELGPSQSGVGKSWAAPVEPVESIAVVLHLSWGLRCRGCRQRVHKCQQLFIVLVVKAKRC